MSDTLMLTLDVSIRILETLYKQVFIGRVSSG